MSQQYLGEIRIFGFNFNPKGWALCNGQTLGISQYTALFSLLGTTYGGNGTTNFMLPNLQGRVPAHRGNQFALGQAGGEAAHTLIVNEMASHNHSLNAATPPAGGGTNAPGGNVPCKPASAAFYNTTPNTLMNPSIVKNTGGGQPHDNMSPYLVLNFCISLVGIFPSRN